MKVYRDLLTFTLEREFKKFAENTLEKSHGLRMWKLFSATKAKFSCASPVVISAAEDLAISIMF